MARHKAFTLSELLFAAFILAFSLSTIILSFITCFVLNEANRNLTRATAHAQYVLEEIKNTAFTTVRDNGNTQWDWTNTTIASKGLTALAAESIDTQVSGTDLLTVTVTANWQGPGTRNRSVSLQTLIAEP